MIKSVEGGMEMREKYLLLIIALQEREGFIKGSELADILQVTDRTVRNYIKDLNENYLVDAKIKNNKNKGYILIGEVNEIKRTQQIEFEERAFFIVKYLLEKEDWVTYDEIAEELLFSNQTIRSDVLKIQQLINHQVRDIKIESVIFKGIILSGSEIDKRLFLDSLSNPPALTNVNFSKQLAYYFKNWTTLEELETLIDYLQNEIDQLKIPTNSEVLLPIISYLIICLKRIENDFVLVDATNLLKKYDVTKTKEYLISKNLFRSIGSQKDLMIPETEIIYFSFYLMGQRLLFVANTNEESHIPDSLKKDVLDTLAQIEKEYNMNFLNDNQLSSGLILHLSRDIYPLLFNFYIENSLITTIKQEYIQAYYIAIRFSHLISQKLQINIPESEIGYLALHFASYIERKKKVKVSGVIVSGRNSSLSFLLKKEIEKSVSNLEIIEIVPFEAISTAATEAELFISTFPLNSEIQCESVTVSELISEKDIIRLNKKVTNILSKNNLEIDYFARLDLSNKEEILNHALTEMSLAYMIDSCLERERLSTTEVGNKIAIPHPLQASCESKTKIGVLILEKEVSWGSSGVSIIFLIVPGVDRESEMSQLMDELHRVVTNNEIVSKLLKSKNKEECIRILK